MRLVCVLSTFENNWGRTDRPTDGRTDTTSYRDATAHLKRVTIKLQPRITPNVKVLARLTNELLQFINSLTNRIQALKFVQYLRHILVEAECRVFG